jgi:hypothetical protein
MKESISFIVSNDYLNDDMEEDESDDELFQEKSLNDNMNDIPSCAAQNESFNSSTLALSPTSTVQFFPSIALTERGLPSFPEKGVSSPSVDSIEGKGTKDSKKKSSFKEKDDGIVPLILSENCQKILFKIFASASPSASASTSFSSDVNNSNNLVNLLNEERTCKSVPQVIDLTEDDPVVVSPVIYSKQPSSLSEERRTPKVSPSIECHELPTRRRSSCFSQLSYEK